MARSTNKNYGPKPNAPDGIIWVRTDGNDTNKGFENNAANAVLTFEGAVDVMKTYDWSNQFGGSCTIIFEDTFATPFVVKSSSITLRPGDMTGIYSLSIRGFDRFDSNLRWGTAPLRIYDFPGELYFEEMNFTGESIWIELFRTNYVDWDKVTSSGLTDFRLTLSAVRDANINPDASHTQTSGSSFVTCQSGTNATVNFNSSEFSATGNGSNAILNVRTGAHVRANAQSPPVTIGAGKWFSVTEGSTLSTNSSTRANFAGDTVADTISADSNMGLV